MLNRIPIPFAPMYSVDRDGNVWTSSYGRLRKLKPCPTGKYGHLHVDLRVGGCYVRILVHRLVCTVFHGQAPTPEHEARHLDGKPSNNRSDNLAWGTHAENMADLVRHGTHWTKTRPDLVKRGDQHYHRLRPETIRRGEENGKAKLTEADIRRIRAEAGEKGAKARLAREFGVSQGAIYNVVAVLCWGHVQ